VLIRQETLRQIVQGQVDLVFRRWTRPSVRTGGTLLSSGELLAIDRVEKVSRRSITDDDARRAGFATRAALYRMLDERPDGDIYRVAVRYLGADPRIDLRASALDDAALATLQKRLVRLDAKGPWTRATLQLIADNPAVRAGDLAASVARETAPFKIDVRKLKNLGMTESLEVGYRISPRGQQYLDSFTED
jgi:hypothetical protein